MSDHGEQKARTITQAIGLMAALKQSLKSPAPRAAAGTLRATLRDALKEWSELDAEDVEIFTEDEWADVLA